MIWDALNITSQVYYWEQIVYKVGFSLDLQEQDWVSCLKLLEESIVKAGYNHPSPRPVWLCVYKVSVSRKVAWLSMYSTQALSSFRRLCCPARGGTRVYITPLTLSWPVPTARHRPQLTHSYISSAPSWPRHKRQGSTIKSKVLNRSCTFLQLKEFRSVSSVPLWKKHLCQHYLFQHKSWSDVTRYSCT